MERGQTNEDGQAPPTGGDGVEAVEPERSEPRDGRAGESYRVSFEERRGIRLTSFDGPPDAQPGEDGDGSSDVHAEPWGWEGDAARAAIRARTLAETTVGGPAFLAEASRLLADSLDYETTLATVAGLALPQLGAWCFVDVTDTDGSLRRLAVVHPDPRKQTLARRLESHWPPQRDDPFGVPRVMRSLRSEILPRVTEEMLEGFARSDENLRSLRSLGMGSLMVVPLVARGEVLGAVTFVSPTSGRAFDDTDLELAEDLAARSAIALDNARLHRATEDAREEAERANRAKSVFLTTMSHELRTPINAIVGYAELLEMELHGPITDQQREHIERIQASSRHLLGLVTEVLDLAKVEAGQMTVRRERAMVEAAVLPALGMVAPQARMHDISVHNACDRDCGVEYVGDEDRVCQIVMNLVSNAVKFTLPGGKVTLSCGVTHEPGVRSQLSGSGPWAFVEVEDDGIGIAEEDQEQIFEPFTQVRGDLTREVGGTGLGLTVSRQLARLMGGDLTLDSALGEGARFTLWLPTDQLPSVEANPEGPARSRGTLDSHTLIRAGSAILGSLDTIVGTLEARLRREATSPAGALTTSVALRDHVGSLLSDIAQSMMILADGGDRHGHLLRDGSKIQRLIAELHGGQRQRMGWTDGDAEREFRILKEEVESVLRTAAGLEPRHVEHALTVATRFLDQAERVSRQGMRSAATAEAM